MRDRKQRQLQARGNADLVENVGQMTLDGELANAELFCNIAVVQTIRYCRHNFQLAVGQVKSLQGRWLVLNGVAQQIVFDPEFTRSHAANRSQQRFDGRVLSEDSVRLTANSFQQVTSFVSRREYQKLRFRILQLAQYLKARGLWHKKVKQQDPRLQLPDNLRCLEPVACFTNHFKIRFGFQNAAETIADNRVIVRNCDSDYFVRHAPPR